MNQIIMQNVSKSPCQPNFLKEKKVNHSLQRNFLVQLAVTYKPWLFEPTVSCALRDSEKHHKRANILLYFGLENPLHLSKHTLKEKIVSDWTASRMFSINDGLATDELNDGGFMAKHTQLLSVQLLFSYGLHQQHWKYDFSVLPCKHQPHYNLFTRWPQTQFVMVQLWSFS